MSIDRLRRTLEADPSNEQNKTRLAIQRARTEGPQVYLEPLMDLGLWNSTNETLQDHAVQEVAQRLGDRWELKGMREWSCECVSKSPEGEELGSEDHLDKDSGWERRSIISHRLATFIRVDTGIELNLLPGRRFVNAITGNGKPIKPFLIARWPVTRGQWYESAHGEGSGVPRIDSYGDRASLPSTGREHYEITSLMSHYDLSLPTPEQWEYSCRAGTSTRFYWGEDFDPSYCWYEGNSGDHGKDPACLEGPHRDHMSCCANEPRPHSPKEHDDAGKHNAFGLVDCIGNVWEWLSDKSAKGGCYSGEEETLQLSYSFRPNPSGMSAGYYGHIGFRPVIAVPGLED